MTKFHYMSDVHLEFGCIPPINAMTGDYVILAGDITCLRCLNPVMNDGGNRKLRDKTRTFFDILQENFKKVFYLTGNHESYNFNIDLEDDYIARYLPGVIHLKNTTYDIDENIVLFGATLWTDMNKGNPLTIEQVGNGMNDFRLIRIGALDENLETRIFHPNDAIVKHQETLVALQECLDANKDKKVIVATHHSPSAMGINKEHTKSAHLDPGYYSDLHDIIEDNPQIKYWVFGHTHIQTQFDIGTTKVFSNSRGYEGYEESARTFTPNKFFEV